MIAKKPIRILSTDQLSEKEHKGYEKIDAVAHNILTARCHPLEFSGGLSACKEGVAITKMPKKTIPGSLRKENRGEYAYSPDPDFNLLLPAGCKRGEPIPTLRPCYPWATRFGYWCLTHIEPISDWRDYSAATWVLTNDKIEL